MKKIYNNEDVERISSEVLVSYLRRIGKGEEIPAYIDIDDFVANYLHCPVVYENIHKSSDCLGYVSNGVKPLLVYRDHEVREVVFPKDTIILDRYLCYPTQETKRRFTLAHEAGHIITSRINRINQEACYHENNGVQKRSKEELKSRFSLLEVFANRFAACLLMPAETVKKYIHSYFGQDKIMLDEYGHLSTYDKALLGEIADKMNVSMSALLLRLNELELYDIYCRSGNKA